MKKIVLKYGSEYLHLRGKHTIIKYKFPTLFSEFLYVKWMQKQP